VRATVLRYERRFGQRRRVAGRAGESLCTGAPRGRIGASDGSPVRAPLRRRRVRWWRRRESNPRPRAFHPRIYMLSRVYSLTVTLPDGQGHVSASPWVLTPARGASDGAIPCLGDPRGRTHGHVPAGGSLSIKQRERSCRRWQLCWLQLDLRGHLPLGMHLGLHHPCQSQVAPEVLERQCNSPLARRAPEIARRGRRSPLHPGAVAPRRKTRTPRPPPVPHRLVADRRRMTPGPRRNAAAFQRTLSRRCFSRCQSRSRCAARLSCCFLPRARPTASFARPRFQNRRSGTRV